MSDLSTNVLTIIAEIYIRPEHQDAVLGAVAACVIASRLEPSNISYDCKRDQNNPQHLVFIEQWESLDALLIHEQTAHFLAMKETFTAGLERPLTVTLLEPCPRMA